MSPWVKFMLILMTAFALVTSIASALDWSLSLLIQGGIIGLLAAAIGTSDTNQSGRRSDVITFLFLSGVIILITFVIEYTIDHGIRSLIIGTLTGDGPPASNTESMVFLSICIETFITGVMIGCIQCRQSQLVKCEQPA